MAVGYAYHLKTKADFLELQNGQYASDLRAWEISYKSLTEEMKKSEEILRKNRRAILNIKKRKRKLEMQVSDFIKGDADAKTWFNADIPPSVIRFRNRMRETKTKPGATDN